MSTDHSRADDQHIPLEPVAEHAPMPRPSINHESLLKGELSACPGCNTPLAGDGVVCTNCGLDLRVGRRRDTDVGVDVVEPARPPEEYLAPATLGPRVHALIAAGFLVLAMVLAGVNAPRGNTWLAIAMVVKTLYTTVLHTGTGVVAVMIVAIIAGMKLTRLDFAAARMFLAFSVYQFVSLIRIPGVPIWLSELGFALVGVSVYLLALMMLMRKNKDQAIAIAAIHFVLWLLFEAGLWISTWVKTISLAPAALVFPL